VKSLFILLLITLTGCCGLHSEVKYQYGNVVISRVDECGKTSFYYGAEPDNDNGIIWSEYSGIGGNFKGYLVFHKDGKVSLFSGDGYFQSKNLDSTKFQYKRILAYENPVVSDSVCYINLSTKYEKEDNLEAASRVKVEYIIDENEFW